MIRMFVKIFARFRRLLELYRYDDFTIAEYFRKQGARIGENNRIEVQSLGPEPYLIKIGNHCTIAQRVSFVAHDGATWVFTEEFPSLQKFGPISILDNCFIGMNSIIMGNVTIGPNSIVGAGSVVTRDVPPGTVVAGNPARKICTIDEYREKALHRWEEQRPQGYFQGLEEGARFSPSYIHMIKRRDQAILERHLVEKFWGKA